MLSSFPAGMSVLSSSLTDDGTRGDAEEGGTRSGSRKSEHRLSLLAGESHAEQRFRLMRSLTEAELRRGLAGRFSSLGGADRPRPGAPGYLRGWT